MRLAALRSLGFFVPTAFVVTTLHVVKDSSPGEWLDGFASSLWFGLVFAIFSCAMSIMRRRVAVPPHASTRRALVIGFLIGAITWPLLWGFWVLPATQSLRADALVVNSVATLLAGIASEFVTKPGEQATV